MTIYDRDGTPIIDAPVTKDAIIKCVLMGDYYIELPFSLLKQREFRRGCYIHYKGRKFEIMSNVRPEFNSKTGGYKYTLKFEAQQNHMTRPKTFWPKSKNAEVCFHDTTSLEDFGTLIADNMNRLLGGENWKVAAVPDDLAKTAKLVSINADNCWNAINLIAEAFEVEWWTVENGSEVWLHFGKLEFGTPEAFKRGDVVTSIPAKKGDDSAYGTRFYVFGSTRNLPDDYNKTEQGGVTNHVSEVRLHLPNGQQYIDAKENLEPEDIVEQVAFFEDIFPKNTETVTSVSTIKRKVENSEDKDRTFDAYVVYCKDTPFIPSDVYEGETLSCKFTSGSLNGREFDLALIKDDASHTVIDPEKWKPEDGFNKKFEIIADVETYGEEGVLTIPNESIRPEAGDTFVLTGVKLPKERITEAENELLKIGQEWAKRNSNDTDVYDCPTNPVYCQRNDKNYDLGQKVLLEDERFGEEGRLSRIQGFEKKLWNEYEATYTVGDNTAYSRLGSIETNIAESAYAERIGVASGVGIYLIRSKYDTTAPTDYNAYSAAATEALFLNKHKGGTVSGQTIFARQVIAPAIQSKDYRDDPFTGSGYRIGNDENGNSVAVVDKLIVRKEASFNEVVINQVSFRLGETVFSNGGCEITNVEDFADVYRCYYDNKGGRRYSGLEVGDQVRCQRYDANSKNIVKYYWRLVTAVGENFVELSKTDADGSGIPEVGDNIVQFGNRAEKSRQSAIAINPLNGGSVEVFSGIDSFTLSERNYVGMGVNPSTGKAYLYGYGDMFFGDRDMAAPESTWITFQQKEGTERPKLYIKGDIEMGPDSTGLGNIQEFKDLEDKVDNIQANNDLDWIHQILPDGVINNAATVSQLLAVKDSPAANANIVAGIYGGGVQKFEDDYGFLDKSGPKPRKLMIFAGAENLESVANAATRIYEDGTIITAKLESDSAKITKAEIENSNLVDATISGTIKSPFQKYSGSFELIQDKQVYDRHDNLSCSGEKYQTHWSPVYNLSWDSSQNGRTITLVNYQGGKYDGPFKIQAKENFVFFEKGRSLNEIVVRQECVVLKGFGEGDVFYGWIVVSRAPMPGYKPDILYEGIVENTRVANPTIVKYKSWDGKKLTVSRQKTGSYFVYFPDEVTIDPNNYTVMLTGWTKSGALGVSHSFGSIYQKQTTFFEVLMADDDSLNDSGFTFQILNTENWTSS